MKFQNIAAGRFIGALMLLTALLCWGGQNNQSQSYKTIHEAAAKGDLEAVKKYLEQGVDVNAKGEDGDTPLHCAAWEGQKEVVELLIAKGADINARDNNGYTPLHDAAAKGHKDVAEMLIVKGAGLNAKNDDGETPLHEAASEGQKEVAELLITKGADINAKDEDGNTLLAQAVSSGKKEMVELLIAKGADINAKDEDGNTLLHKAASKGQVEAAEQLIAKGADINAKANNGKTPLLNAVGQGHKEVAELLIAKGADVNATDKYGETPLLTAISAYQKDGPAVVELLIAKGADIHTKDQIGETPLHKAAHLDKKEAAELLISKGANVNAKDKNGKTPLYSAALTGSKETAELLIARGADVDARDKDGMTPLARAAMQAYGAAHNETAKLLVAKGADVNAADKDGWTPLHQAVLGGRLEMARLLISFGADIEAKESRGETPLHVAATCYQKEVAELLIANGADIEAKDNSGKTPLQLIIESKFVDPRDAEMKELLTAAQALGEKANAVLAEATRKVIHRPSKSPSKRLAEINTLKYAFIDPNTRRVSFIGTYDPAYASGPISYADLLAEALDHPYPSFSLDEGPSKPAVQAINRLFDKELERVSTDLEYGIQWMQNIIESILQSKSPIPERLVLEQNLKQFGIEPRGFMAYLDLKKSNADFTSEEQYQLVKRFMGELFASIGVEERYGQALELMSKIQQMIVRGQDDKAIADGLYQELGEFLGLIEEMQSPVNEAWIWVQFYSRVLKGLGVPAGQVDAMANRADIHSNRSDAELAPALNARAKTLAAEALQRTIFNRVVLSQSFLKRMYSLPTIYSGVRLYGQRADSPLTRVMFDADYALKYVTTLNPDTASLPGYLSTVEFLSAAAERLGRSDELKEGYVREWIHPGALTLEPFTDNSGVRFASATLRIGVEPLDDASKEMAWLRPVLSEYASRLSERYDDYARLFPSLHVMRETEKIIGLARWIKQNSLQVDVPKARPVANPVPDRVEGFIDLVYVRKATGATDDVFVCADGGVVFDQNEGDGWIKTQPSVTTTHDVLEQLAASVALAEQASAAALSGNMEGARDLAQRSADAMTGRIDMSGLPEPVMAPELAPNESVAGRAEVAQAAIAATEANTAALAKARTDLQQAEPLKTSDPARYAQIQQQSQATVTQAEQNLRHLQDMMAKYRLKPFDFPEVAVNLRELNLNKQLIREPKGTSSGTVGQETGTVPITPKPEDWSEKCLEWSAKLDEVNRNIEGTREVLLKLNASILADRKQFEECKKAANNGFDRCIDMELGFLIDVSLGYLTKRYDEINDVAAKLPDPEGVEKYSHLTSLFKNLEEAKGAKDLDSLAAGEGKTVPEFFEILRDGIGQIAEIVLTADKWILPVKAWKYGSLGFDILYNITEIRLLWKNLTVLEDNNLRYLEAVRKLTARMQDLVKRQKEYKQKIEACEPIDFKVTNR